MYGSLFQSISARIRIKTSSKNQGFMAPRIIIMAVVVFVMLACGASSALAKDYHFTKVNIDVQVQPDGSFDFTEKRTYKFSGDYSWAYYKLYLQGASDITDFQILEGDKVFEESHTQTPGTVQISKTTDYIYAKWFYKASDEERTFTIKYHAVGAIKAYKDIAEFYWKFIGPECEKSTDNVSVTVHLPAGASKDDIRAWGHGPLNGKVTIVDGQTVEYDVSNLPTHTFVEGRITFPPNLLPNILSKYSTDRLPEILKEEKKWVDEANRKRWMVRIGNIIAIMLPIFTLILAFIFWLVFGKEHSNQYAGDYYRELPGDYEPAIAGYLWNFGSVNMNDLVATIMDLARRGFLKIKETTAAKKGLFSSSKSYDYVIEHLSKDETSLKPFEQNLINYLFSKIGASAGTTNTVSMDQIEDYAKSHTRSFQNFINKWKNQVIAQSKQYGFIESTGTYIMYLNIAIAIILMATGFLLVFSGIIGGIFTIICAVVQISVSGLFKRRSKEGALQYEKWVSFRRFLLHFSNLKEAIPESMEIWEHYLVYAVTLGVAKEVIKQLKIIVPQITDETHAYMGPAWFESSRGIDGLSSLDALSTSFSSMVSTATSSMSSASGGGGGFSGGGGGGGGGGGAGAG